MINIEIIAKIVSPIITLFIGALIKRYMERRPKLVTFLGYISSFSLEDDNQTRVSTHNIVVGNMGKKSAHNVRVGHNFLPIHIQINPPILNTIEKNKNEHKDTIKTKRECIKKH